MLTRWAAVTAWGLAATLASCAGATDAGLPAPMTGDEMPENLTPGSDAPNVTMTLHSGDTIALASLKGNKVLLWFYPKDDTPG